MTPRAIVLIALLSLLLAVGLGAFGAHAIKNLVPAARVLTWNTAVEYQFYHGLGLLGLGIWSQVVGMTRTTQFAALCLILGMVLFCGSLYGLVISGLTALGMITPFGGVLFMLAWLLWAVSVYQTKSSDSQRF